MAKLVLGIGSSHSPALNVPASDYHHLAERDLNLEHFHIDGTPCSYEELLQRRVGQFENDIRPTTISSRIQACNKNIENHEYSGTFWTHFGHVWTRSGHVPDVPDVPDIPDRTFVPDMFRTFV